MRALGWSLGVLGLVATSACNARSESEAPGSDAATGGASAGAGGVGPGGAGGAGSGGDAGALVDCSPLVNSLAAKLPSDPVCTAVIRLAYQSLQVVGHVAICGPVAVVDEASARAVAQADTGYGHGALVSGSAPPDAWVFNVPPLDFGGVVAVGARHGLTVFGGGIVVTGGGEVTYPPSFEQDDLGQSCMGPDLPDARGIDLSRQPAEPLPVAEVQAVAQRAQRTAMPGALAKERELTTALVLLYPPAVGFTPEPGGFLASEAEYVVLLTAE